MNQPEKLILASGSPRRQQILKEAGINFLIQTKPTVEDYPPTLPVTEVPEYLARLKAEAFRPDLDSNKVILSADTVVILNDTIIGKPENPDHAFRMLKSLSGKRHDVVTGVCFLSEKNHVSFTDTTEVFFKEISDEQIRFYLDKFKPYDKAGSYGIQEWIGYVAVEKIVGSFYNVMGLPIHKVVDYLKYIR